MEPTYYWARGEEAVGPMPEENLRQLIAERTIIPETFVLQEGEGQQWRLARSVFPDAFPDAGASGLTPKLSGARRVTDRASSGGTVNHTRRSKVSGLTRQIRLRADSEPAASPVPVKAEPTVLKDIFWVFGGLNLAVVTIILPLAIFAKLEWLFVFGMIEVGAFCLTSALVFFGLAQALTYLHAAARNQYLLAQHRLE